jgi:hypothetical protein
MPRWSVVSRLPWLSVQTLGLPASIAGLPESKGIVWVGPPLYPKCAELGVDVVQIAGAAQIAGAIAAQVVAPRAHGSIAVSPKRAVRNDAILEHSAAKDTAAAGCAISAEGAVADHHNAEVVDAAALAISKMSVGSIAVEGAIVDKQRTDVVDAAAEASARNVAPMYDLRSEYMLMSRRSPPLRS